jgi:hypothetical protein
MAKKRRKEYIYSASNNVSTIYGQEKKKSIQYVIIVQRAPHLPKVIKA